MKKILLISCISLLCSCYAVPFIIIGLEAEGDFECSNCFEKGFDIEKRKGPQMDRPWALNRKLNKSPKVASSSSGGKLTEYGKRKTEKLRGQTSSFSSPRLS